jgi:replicative DNA helicase
MADDLTREAERIVLGAMMLDPSVIERVTAQLRSGDFADLRHGSIFAAVVANYAGGAQTDPVGVSITLNSVKELQRVGGAPYLHDLIAAVPTTASATWYAGRVAESARIRAAEVDAIRLRQAVDSGDLGQVDMVKAGLIERWTAGEASDAADDAAELDDFLIEEEREYDWLIPGLIERGDRWILTAGEGDGKSTLMRQLGIQASSGIHPFTLADIDPLRVMLVDLENSEGQIRRKIRPLRLAAGDRYQRKPGMYIIARPGGIDLCGGDGPWLLERARHVQPDMILTGPLYKLAAGDPTEERTARTVIDWLDRIRTTIGAAIVLEAHTPHGANGGRRPIRPYGASLYMRWPEFGIFLSREGQLQHWRPGRDEREWPVALKRGGTWPWTVVTDAGETRWARVVELCTDAGRRLSEREIAKALGVGNGTAHRLITDNRIQWDWLDINLQVSGGGAE